MKNTQKQAVAVWSILGVFGLIVVLAIGQPDPQACAEAKGRLNGTDLGYAILGMQDLQDKLHADRQTMSPTSSWMIAELYRKRKESRAEERQRDREKLERERDQACGWFNFGG